LLSSS